VVESVSSLLFRLLLLMFSLAVIGEPLRFLLSRFSRFFKGLDILQVLVLNVYLGGLILYAIAMVPFGLFSSATMWIVLFFSVSFVIVELLIKRFRLPEKCDILRFAVVLAIFLVALWIQLIPISNLVFGSVHDTSLHSLFVQVLLENRQVPLLLQPYSAEGIVYPQGFHPIVAYAVCVSNSLIPSAVLHITALFSAMSVLGAYYLGKALSSRWGVGLSLAFVFAFVAVWPKHITWGSNAFVASIPLYFICLSFVPSLLKKKRELGVLGIVFIGILFGYLAAMHLQPYETLIASIVLWWLINIAVSKRKALSQLKYMLPIILISMIPIAPFYYRGLIWHPYPYHNIGLPADIEFTIIHQDFPKALFNVVTWLWNNQSYYTVMNVLYLTLLILSTGLAIFKIRKNGLGSRVTRISLATLGGQLLVALLATVFPDVPFSAQPVLLYLSFYVLIGVFPVWVYQRFSSFLSKKIAKRDRAHHGKFSVIKDSKVLLTTLLVITLINGPFIFSSIARDPQMVLGAYSLFAVTSADDLDLMLWMKDNLPHNVTILVNKQECGLFIPSVSHHKVIFPFIFSHHSRSYKLLSTLLEEEAFNATTFNLMKHFNITHVYVGSSTTAHDMYSHKWSPAPFLQNPNFDLVNKVGNAYLFAFSYKYPEVVFQDDFEYESPTETGWEFYVAKECEETGFGEATISSNHAYHGSKSLMITAKKDKEGYYVCWVSKKVHVWNASNVTLSFYLNATSGFHNDLDHSAIMVADTSLQRTITLSTPYANISSEYIELSDSQGFFEFNLSEIWYQEYNSTLPTDFYIRLENFDADGIKNTVFFDYITLVCND